MSDEKSLNKEQLEAVTYGGGPLLIIAGAGTGKTTVIAERIKFLISEKGISPSEILALTFTEKAAKEMQERVDVALPLGYANLWISTFHSFGDRILRDEAVNIGLDPRYKLMTEAEAVQYFRQNLFKFDLNYFRPLGNPTKFVVGMLQHFSRLKDEDVDPSEYLAWIKNKNVKSKNKNDPEEHLPRAGVLRSRALEEHVYGASKTNDDSDLGEEVKKYGELAGAYQKYEELKIKESLLDFSDLITWSLKLFRERKKILENYQKKFKYILVDEFQDTNYAQNQLVLLLAGQKPNLTVVADDDQAIYRWRGASTSNVIQFTQQFPQTKIVTLTKNYRSTQTILDVAYQVIQNNNPDRLEVKEKIDKKLIAVREDKVREMTPEFYLADRVENEAEFVARTINSLINQSTNQLINYKYSDFAILVRANNHAEPFIRALSRAGIPYQFLGPGQLFRQPEVKDLIAYLSVLYNFEDSIAMYRLLAMDLWQIPGRDLAAITNYARKLNLSLFESGEQIEKINVSKSTKETVEKIVAMINRHLNLAKKETAGQIIYYFLEDSGLLKELVKVDSAKEEVAVQNIAKFFDRLKSYESSHQDASVNAIMDFINLSMELGDSPLASEIDWTGNNAVNLLTVHSAKGLEFPVVFLVNLVAQRFPTTERREQIPIPDELVKEILPAGDPHLEEERRLFYVGLTRAKDRLYLSAAKYYGDGKREKKVSPFVAETLGDVSVIGHSSSVTGEKQLSFLDYAKKEDQSAPLINQSTNQPINYLSYSQIEAFLTCPLLYKYRYILRLPTPPSAALTFGDTIHQTMKDFYQRLIAGQKPTQKDLIALLKENWNSLGYTSKAHEKRYFDQGITILTDYYLKSFGPKLRPITLEQEFVVKVSPNLKVGGRIDRIDKASGGFEIIDYKTGKTPTKKDIENDLQLTIYAMAAVEGSLTAMRVIDKIPRPEEVTVSFYFFDSQQKYSAIRKPEDFEKAKQKILEIAGAINKSDFSPTPGKHCDFCEYKMLCDCWK